MNKPILISIVVIGLLLILGLIASIVYVATESERQGVSHSRENMTHKLNDKNSPEEVYSFMEEAAQAAKDDGEAEAAAGILEAMRPLSRGFADKKQYIECSNKLGTIYLEDQNRPGSAQRLFKEVLELRKKDSGDKVTKDIADTLLNLGAAKCENGTYAEALKDLEAALKAAQGLGEKELIARCRYRMADVLMYQEKWEEAEQHSQESLKIYEKDPQLGDKEDLAKAYQQIGFCRLQMSQPDKAVVALEKAQEYYKEAGKQDLDVVEDLKDLGWVELSLGRREKAREYFQRVMTAASENSDEKTTSAVGYVLKRL
ncbi:MAG TPA: tetratricopeptide repeat protein [Candidatus Obscuribacter sp.]|nr:tetratricopeptide repeat protein [Candidatus Obscuribacter sp.]HND05505.1 tetratricopeptide repeat protein [Candidatus Obscuribacter sp.]HND68954.1 tetratricopeptide repeat protein [Candidatus Obscuribacter sp.]HNN62817.1 tetratricopeptide repeat protein [Candidatus Obscuribacter sp.]